MLLDIYLAVRQKFNLTDGVTCMEGNGRGNRTEAERGWLFEGSNIFRLLFLSDDVNYTRFWNRSKYRDIVDMKKMSGKREEPGELQVGDVVLGRYLLKERLGSGAMGVVFRCLERVSQVEYALKMVPPELARDADLMEDVRENFRLVNGLKHPNIASMDFLERDEYGSYFLIMEYVQGENLTRWIRRKWSGGRPGATEMIHVVEQIAAALDYAHQKQILHRDIKPANVMAAEDGNIKVLDFGLASKVRSSMTALSLNPANANGTPAYLSPEQFKGRYPGPAADQYALVRVRPRTSMHWAL